LLALTQGRSADAERELAWAKGKPQEYRFVSWQSRAMLEAGKLHVARELKQQALELEKNQKLQEVESGELGGLATAEADFGACDRARQDAAVLTANPTQDGLVLAGYVFATCGEAAKAEAIAADLGKKYPLETDTQKFDIPQIRARQELQRGSGAKAIEQLRPTEGREFGYIGAGIPAYLRGLAYLQLKQGAQAAAEFQKFLDHRGAVGASPYSGLAQLGLARAYSVSGDSAKARIAYQDFFTLWKDADPDIPILKEAKAEYEKLR
jgi:eukaryotic-like serine/threonine-protein kinase